MQHQENEKSNKSLWLSEAQTEGRQDTQALLFIRKEICFCFHLLSPLDHLALFNLSMTYREKTTTGFADQESEME